MELGFPSRSWVERYVDVLNKSPAFARATKGWVWKILFEVQEPSTNTRKGFVLDISDGVCQRYEYLEDVGRTNAPYRVWAPRDVWIDLLLGRIGALDAIGQSKIRIAANQATLGRFTETVKVLLEHFTKTPK